MTARRDPFGHPVRARFWAQVAQGGLDECWPWKGGVDRCGYGQVSIDGKKRSAHRVAFFLATGNPADGLSVLHRCDNPPCCNPSHLFSGTHQLNMADRSAKGRTASGERNGRAKLTWATVNAIRAAYVPFKNTLPMLSEQFGVNRYVIQDILRGRTWQAPSDPSGPKSDTASFNQKQEVSYQMGGKGI